MLAFVVDIVVWYKAGSISFVEEQEAEEGTVEEMTTLKSQDAQAVDNDYLWNEVPVDFDGYRMNQAWMLASMNRDEAWRWRS